MGRDFLLNKGELNIRLKQCIKANGTKFTMDVKDNNRYIIENLKTQETNEHILMGSNFHTYKNDIFGSLKKPLVRLGCYEALSWCLDGRTNATLTSGHNNESKKNVISPHIDIIGFNIYNFSEYDKLKAEENKVLNKVKCEQLINNKIHNLNSSYHNNSHENNIKHIFMSINNMIFLSKEGNLYGLGNNEHFTLTKSYLYNTDNIYTGNTNRYTEKRSHLLKEILNTPSNINSVSNWQHSTLISNNNGVYFCGKIQNSEFPLENYLEKLHPWFSDINAGWSKFKNYLYAYADEFQPGSIDNRGDADDTPMFKKNSVFYDILPKWWDGSRWDDHKNTPDVYAWTNSKTYLFKFQFEKYKFRNYLPLFINKFKDLSNWNPADDYLPEIFDIDNSGYNVIKQFSKIHLYNEFENKSVGSDNTEKWTVSNGTVTPSEVEKEFRYLKIPEEKYSQKAFTFNSKGNVKKGLYRLKMSFWCNPGSEALESTAKSGWLDTLAIKFSISQKINNVSIGNETEVVMENSDDFKKPYILDKYIYVDKDYNYQFQIEINTKAKIDNKPSPDLYVSYPSLAIMKTEPVIKKIINKYNNVLLLSEKGVVYQYGKNSNGMMYHSNNLVETPIIKIPSTRDFRKINNEFVYYDNPQHKIVDIAMGDGVYYAVRKDGKVYSWGKNNKKMLGRTRYNVINVEMNGKNLINGINSQIQEKYRTYFINTLFSLENKSSLQDLSFNAPILYGNLLNGKKQCDFITDIPKSQLNTTSYTSYDNSNENTKCYCCGFKDNTYFYVFEIRLGQYNKFIEYKTLEYGTLSSFPTTNNNLKELFKDRGIARNNNEMSDETIDIYNLSFEYSSNIAYNSQKTDNLTIDPTPSLIPGLSNVKKIVVSQDTVCALTNNNKISLWGHKYDENTLHNLPPVELTTTQNITDIATTHNAFIYLTDKGNVYLAGQTNITNGTTNSKKDIGVKQDIENVSHIYGGYESLALITNIGEISTKGNAKNNRLGHSNDNDYTWIKKPKQLLGSIYEKLKVKQKEKLYQKEIIPSYLLESQIYHQDFKKRNIHSSKIQNPILEQNREFGTLPNNINSISFWHKNNDEKSTLNILSILDYNNVLLKLSSEDSKYLLTFPQGSLSIVDCYINGKALNLNNFNDNKLQSGFKLNKWSHIYIGLKKELFNFNGEIYKLNWLEQNDNYDENYVDNVRYFNKQLNKNEINELYHTVFTYNNEDIMDNNIVVSKYFQDSQVYYENFEKNIKIANYTKNENSEFFDINNYSSYSSTLYSSRRQIDNKTLKFGSTANQSVLYLLNSKLKQ